MMFINSFILFPASTRTVSVTKLGTENWITNSGTKTVTATPTAGSLIVIITGHSGNSSTAAPTDDQGDGGTYSQVTLATATGNPNTLIAWVRSQAITNSASTVFTHAPGASTGGGLVVLEVSDMLKFGATAIKQSKNADAQGNTRPSITFDATPQSTNPIIGAILNASNPCAVAPRTGYTEVVDTGYATPATGLQAMTLDSGETSATIQWGVGASATAHCGLILEMDAS